MTEQDLMAELDPRELALLDAYREASEPSPEIEDRLFARLQAAIEVEQHLGGHEGVGSEAPTEEPARRKGVSAVTTVVVAITAFAAGVALTVGLRGNLAQMVEGSSDNSVAPMVADDAGPRQAKPAAEGQACEVVEVPVRVEVPVQVPTPNGTEAREGSEQGAWGAGASSRSQPAAGDDSGGIEDHDDESHARRRTPRSEMIAVAPWSGPASAGDPSSDPRSRRRRDRRSSSTATGVGRGSGLGGGGRTAGSGPTAGGGPAGPGGSNGNDGPAPGSRPGSRPGGNGPSPSDPGQPPTPTDPKGPDDSDPTPPPWDDEPDMPPDDGTNDCYLDFDMCMRDADFVCTEAPDACNDALFHCEELLSTCDGQDYPPPPEDDPYLQCEQDIEACYAMAQVECEQQMQQDPTLCDELWMECEQIAEQCYGPMPPPPPSWPGIPGDQDDADEDPDGHLLD